MAPNLSIAIMGNKIYDFTSIDDKEIAVKHTQESEEA